MTRVVFLIYFLKQNFDLLFILNVAMDKYHVLAEPMTIIQKVNRKSQIWGLGGFAAEIQFVHANVIFNLPCPYVPSSNPGDPKSVIVVSVNSFSSVHDFR